MPKLTAVMAVKQTTNATNSPFKLAPIRSCRAFQLADTLDADRLHRGMPTLPVLTLIAVGN
jgi:hypothetical protein